MTEKFVSSNNVTISKSGGSSLYWDEQHDQGSVNNKARKALKEYFTQEILAERDTELGRWRWDLSPDYVVYRNEGDGVVEYLALSESTGESTDYITLEEVELALHRGDLRASDLFRAISAYVTAHPEPKPWHDAHRNELWLLDFQGGSGLEPYLVVGGTGCQDGLRFRHVNHIDGHECDVTSPYIRSGRRIYPEASE